MTQIPLAVEPKITKVVEPKSEPWSRPFPKPYPHNHTFGDINYRDKEVSSQRELKELTRLRMEK